MLVPIKQPDVVKHVSFMHMFIPAAQKKILHRLVPTRHYSGQKCLNYG